MKEVIACNELRTCRNKPNIKGNRVQQISWCDNGNVNASNFPNFGGNYNNGDNAGPFNWNFNNSASATYSLIGSRNSYNSRSNSIHTNGGQIPVAMPLGKIIKSMSMTLVLLNPSEGK